jgi:hypothetical protein
MNPSSRSRHQQTTRLVPGAGHFQHRVKAQIGWGIEKFVRTTRSHYPASYCVADINVDNPPPARYPTFSVTLSSRPALTVRTNTDLSQVRTR